MTMQYCPSCRRPVTQITAGYPDSSPLQPRTYWPCGHAPIRQLVAESRDSQANVYAHTVDCNTTHEGPGPCPPPLVEAIALAVRDYRDSYRLSLQPNPWYAHLSTGRVHQGGRTFEQFAAEFDESVRRIDVRRVGLVGFEVEYYPGQIRRHRISWLDGETAAPRQEDPDNDH